MSGSLLAPRVVDMYGSDLAEETAFVLAVRRLRELLAAIERGPADTEVYVGILVEDPNRRPPGAPEPPPRVSRSHRGDVEVVVTAGPVSILARPPEREALRLAMVGLRAVGSSLGWEAPLVEASIASVIGQLAIAGFPAADEPEEPSADDLAHVSIAVPSTDAETRLLVHAWLDRIDERLDPDTATLAGVTWRPAGVSAAFRVADPDALCRLLLAHPLRIMGSRRPARVQLPEDSGRLCRGGQHGHRGLS